MSLSLYAIDAELEALLNSSVNRETGEIEPDALAAIEALEMARADKCLAVAAYIVGQRAEGDAVKAQAKHLAERAAKHARHAERLEEYLRAHIEEGAKLRDARVEIGWRKSTAVEIDVDPINLPEQYVRIRCDADKSAIKDALKAGTPISGARLVSRMNLVVR